MSTAAVPLISTNDPVESIFEAYQVVLAVTVEIDFYHVPLLNLLVY